MDDQNAPATKGDLATLKDEIINEITEVIRDSETKLLSAFYGYAKTNDKRVLEVEGNEQAIRSRVATLESRVLDLEQKVNTPPPR